MQFVWSLRLLGIALVGCGVFSGNAVADEVAGPNILLLMADDWRADCIGALGHSVVQTPAIDSLVKRGTTFEAAYCLGSNSGAVCQPSRNMLLSGKAYFRWIGLNAPADGASFPATLKAGGYETWHCGKRGNTAQPIQDLFEHNHYIDEDAARLSGHPGQEITDKALAFLEKRDPKRPFFMYLGYEAPHDPRVPAKEEVARYADIELALPKNFLPQHPFDNGEMEIRDEKLLAWPRDEAALRKELRIYYGAITSLDRQIGRLLSELDHRGDTTKTIVIFSSDHGLALGSHGLLGKQNLYEHSMRAPLIFAGPRIPAAKTQALAYLLDLLPTVCGLTSIPIPENLDGKDLTPVIMGHQATVRKTLGLAYRDVQRAIRDERWKLICYPQINHQQLFDLVDDPGERNDLSTKDETLLHQQRLQTALLAWQAELGDKQPLRVTTPKSSLFTPPTGPALPLPTRSKARPATAK